MVQGDFWFRETFGSGKLLVQGNFWFRETFGSGFWVHGSRLFLLHFFIQCFYYRGEDFQNPGHIFVQRVKLIIIQIAIVMKEVEPIV